VTTGSFQAIRVAAERRWRYIPVDMNDRFFAYFAFPGLSARVEAVR